MRELSEKALQMFRNKLGQWWIVILAIINNHVFKSRLNKVENVVYCIKQAMMKTRAYILNRLRNHKKNLEPFGIKSIGIFGSYAREEQTSGSDIDILVDLSSEHENFDNYMALCDYLESLFQGVKAEIVTKSGLSPYIGPKILNEVIYV